MNKMKKDVLGRRGAYGIILFMGLFLGLTGIRWGLPGQGRIKRIMPPELHTTQFHEALESSWKALHARFGKNLMPSEESWIPFSGVLDAPSGWDMPPEILFNGIRSFHVRSVHEDEQSMLLALSKMRPKKLDFNPHFFSYGGTYIYVLGAWLGAGAVIGAVPLHRSLLPYLDSPEKMGALFAWGRLLSVAGFIACGFMLWEIGRKIAGPWTGLSAALFFMLSPGAVVQAHTMKPHMYWPFFTFLTLYLCLRVLEKGGRREYLLAGAASGLAVGSAVCAWPTCFIVAVAAGIRIWEKPAKAQEEVYALIGAALCSIAAFFITNPYWILDWNMAYAEMKVLSRWSSVNAANPFYLVWYPLRNSMSIPVFSMVCAGAAWALSQGKKGRFFVLCGGAFLVMAAAGATTRGVVSTRQIRYFIPLIGVGALLASCGMKALVDKMPRWRAGILAVIVAMGIHMGVAGVLYALNFRRTASENSNHHLAGEWIDSNVPEGASVGLLREPAPSNSPYFNYRRVTIRLIQPELFGTLAAHRLPDYMAVTSPDYDDRPRLEPNLSRIYEVAARFDRMRLAWARIDPTSTTANPLIEIYRKKSLPVP